jgi:hypothetical protein
VLLAIISELRQFSGDSGYLSGFLVGFTKENRFARLEAKVSARYDWN